MHISAVEEYGLRCALQLAALAEGEVLAASQIAEREGISVQYASKIMHIFRKAGLVQAVRGMQGGFRLGKLPIDIPIRDVFSALRETKNSITFCHQYTGNKDECVHLQACSVRPVWQILASYFDSVLEKISLADLVRNETDARKRVELFAKGEAERIQLKFGSVGEMRE